VSRWLAAAALTMGSAGCLFPQNAVPTPYQVVQDTRDPAQYRSALPRDVQGSTLLAQEAYGESCRTMLSFPTNPPTPFLGSATAASLLPWPSYSVTWGNDGYAKAVAKALQRAGGGTLVDVRADLHTTAVLGILRWECIEVHGLVAKTPG
jgi:hypothetical protein